MTAPDTNYFHRRGITVSKVKATCIAMGLNQCYWNHLSVAFEVCKANSIK